MKQIPASRVTETELLSERAREREEKIGMRRHVTVRSFEQDRWYVCVRKREIYRDQVRIAKIICQKNDTRRSYLIVKKSLFSSYELC